MFGLKSTLAFALISLASALPANTPRSITSGIVALWTTSGARLNFVSPKTADNGGFATTSDSTEAMGVVANQAFSGAYSLDVDGSSLFVGTEDSTGVTLLAGIASASAVWNVDTGTGQVSSATGLVPFITSEDDYSSVWMATGSGSIPSGGQAVNIFME